MKLLEKHQQCRMAIGGAELKLVKFIDRLRGDCDAVIHITFVMLAGLSSER